ncbi:MAG: thioredoxin family protein [Henriciella sp.]|jgi:thiol-disulfide isomerase/thioredoxin|nr:thioredoxin family protein [Henriciella sp.]MBO6694083.1 thioredoxin family protein [Henriciella sp.]
MRMLFAALIISVASPFTAGADPSVKIINFTADWCPNCQILNPRLEEAMEGFEDGSIERVDLDVTRIRRNSSPVDRAEVQTEILLLADQHQVAYLWDWYGGITGIAVAVAADNGEPLTCFMRPMTAKAIQGQLRLAKMLAEQGTPGQRKPDGPDCPVL